MALLVTEETAPAVEIDIQLPSLPDLAARTGTEGRLVAPLLAWSRSWEGVGDPTAREASVTNAAPVLSDALGDGGVATVLAPLHRAVSSVDGVESLPLALQERVERIRSVALSSRRALEAGRSSDALRDGLVAADRLRDLGPEAVARALVERGERTLAGLPDRASDPDDVELRRGRGLLDRARRALESGEFSLAVQRAFYACQLLEASAKR
jgi:hypothetical protein